MIQFTCANSIAVEYLQELTAQMGLEFKILSGDEDLLVEGPRVVEVSGDPMTVQTFTQAYGSWVTFKNSQRQQQVNKLERCLNLF